MIIIYLLIAIQASAQRHIDLFSSSYIRNSTQVDYYNANATVPIQSKSKKTILLLQPYYDYWQVTGSTVLKERRFKGIGIPVTIIRSFDNENWQAILSVVFRDHDMENHAATNQYGSAVLLGFRKSNSLNYKLGLYYNREYFGNFLMPLFGIDWQISKNTQLFGVLPGSLTFEYRIKYNLYTGAAFRAVTTSYRLPDKDYLRIDDNRIGIFADIYLTRNIVLNAEAGHSVFRRFQTGNELQKSELPIDDHFYLRFQLAYRLRVTQQ